MPENKPVAVILKKGESPLLVATHDATNEEVTKAVEMAMDPKAVAAAVEKIQDAAVELPLEIIPKLDVVPLHPQAPPEMVAPHQPRPETTTTTTSTGQTAAEEIQTGLRTAGQRTVNLMWETTQMRLALWTIGPSFAVASILALAGKWLGSPELQLASIVFMYGVANLVVGFYFGRTNHQRVGGVGAEVTGR